MSTNEERSSESRFRRITVGEVQTVISADDTVGDLFDQLNTKHPGGLALDSEATKLVHPGDDFPDDPDDAEDVPWDLSTVDDGDELGTYRLRVKNRPAYEEVEA